MDKIKMPLKLYIALILQLSIIPNYVIYYEIENIRLLGLILLTWFNFYRTMDR